MSNNSTVTGALRKVLKKQEIEFNWLFSDSRKPKGYTKAVGVKIASQYLSDKQIAKIQAKMEKNGFIAVSAKLADYRPLKKKYPGRYTPWGGTRLTFAKPEWKKA
jgi:hypothetical protein